GKAGLGLAITSLGFALMHEPWPGDGGVLAWLSTTSVYVAMGLGFGLVYVRTGRYWAAVLAHAVCNLMAMLLLQLGGGVFPASGRAIHFAGAGTRPPACGRVENRIGHEQTTSLPVGPGHHRGRARGHALQVEHPAVPDLAGCQGPGLDRAGAHRIPAAPRRQHRHPAAALEHAGLDRAGPALRRPRILPP